MDFSACSAFKFRASRALLFLLPSLMVWCWIAYHALDHNKGDVSAKFDGGAQQRIPPDNSFVGNVSGKGPPQFWTVEGTNDPSGISLEEGVVQRLSQHVVEDRLDAPREDVLMTGRPHDGSREVSADAPAAKQLVQAQAPRVAICLVGGARAFEQTGHSIRTHLLGAYQSSDIFFNVPLTENVHKLTLLTGIPNLATIAVLPQKPIVTRPHANAVLTSEGSPNGLQGLLAYFELVEGCLELIQTHARQRNLSYDWVFRTRVDTFWNGPPPPLASLDPTTYTVPHGSDYFGLNDRAGIGSMATSYVALRRLSCLAELHARKGRGFNSEQALREQMVGGGVEVSRRNFSFCVLTQRIYGQGLPRPKSVPVLSLSTQGALNGAKCRACKPIGIGENARRVAAALLPSHGWFGAASEPQFCDGAQDPYHQGWEAEFDEAAGLAAAEVRKEMSSRSQSDCERAYTELIATLTTYRGPPATVVCQLGVWGKIGLIGVKQDWPILWSSLVDKSVVYSFGGGYIGNYSGTWEEEVAKVSKQEVHIFSVSVNDGGEDGSPGAHSNSSWNVTLRSTMIASAANPGEATVFRVTNTSGQPAVKALEDAMTDLGHKHVQILKIDAGKSSTTLFLRWSKETRVCQIIIKFSLPLEDTIVQSQGFELLNNIGYTFLKCVGDVNDEKCLFVSSRHCNNGR